MAAVCHPSLAPKRPNPTARDLKDHIDRIGLIGSLSNRYRYNPSESAIQQLGKPTPQFAINSQEAQKQMCLEKGGAVVLAKFIVEKEIKNGHLAEIALPRPVAIGVFVAHRQGRSLSHNADVFLNAFRASLGKI